MTIIIDEIKKPRSKNQDQKTKSKLLYCDFCKRQVIHDKDESNFICRRCGSSRLDKIQGFDASLM